MPENRSFSCGYWRLYPMVLTCIGSSAAMPVPMLIYEKPKLLKSKTDYAKPERRDRSLMADYKWQSPGGILVDGLGRHCVYQGFHDGKHNRYCLHPAESRS